MIKIFQQDVITVATVRQEILMKGKFDEFDESFVSSIFNSSNFYLISASKLLLFY